MKNTKENEIGNKKKALRILIKKWTSQMGGKFVQGNNGKNLERHKNKSI